jgi:uncharacterized pyridoxal phosphate-containing UPF0001 family protein
MVGSLQTNKVKNALGIFDYVHSLDRESLAMEIEKRAGARKIPCFIEVNVSGEETKRGVAPGNLTTLFNFVRERCASIDVIGLMTMAPFSEDAEKSRPIFARLRELAAGLGLPHLSMGMTQDYEVAIEEGATFLRIGSAFFTSSRLRSQSV